MGQIKHIGDLEIDQDMAFQRSEWKVQRTLWVVAAAVLVLALIGLFGAGPISSTTVDSDDGTVSVDYHRFVRHDGRAALNVEIDASHASNQEIEFWLSQDFLDNAQLENISPAPKEVRDDNGRMVYVFAVTEGSDTLNATFAYRPEHIGRLSAEAGSGESTVSVNEISYP